MPAKLHVPPGQRFGRLEVLYETRVEVSERLPRGRRGFVCRCDCGTEVAVALSNLGTGNSTSCGCLFREGRAETNRLRAEAGYKHHPLKVLHNGIVRRCLDPKNKDYARYGGRGIQLHAPWRHRGTFIEYVERELGPRPSPKHSIDRIDTRGNYEPGNIRWNDPLGQRHNSVRPARLLADEDITEIRRRYAASNGLRGSAHRGVTQAQLAAEFKVSQHQVSRVVRQRERFAPGD